ncbi:MAG: hypothetical protein LBI36_06970 [Oscillospiraceae bacterium]|jgi:hypothetical protein|nr:hypothetical protein [Oscillospiraceae bacterium]
MLKQISIFVENKSGRLCAVMETLAEAKIDVRAMTIADTAEFGIVRLIVNDAEKAANALKENSFTVKVTEVIAFTIPDHFGALYDVIKLLGENGINIEYSYSLMGKNQKEADIVIKVADAKRAGEILAGAGVKLIEIEDVV